jgi:hypothetical protein
MHCLNPTYDQAVILPPYNTVWAQVVKRGNPPQVVTTGLSVEYQVLDNTYSYGKGSYGQFWDYMSTLFATTRPHDKGLNLDNPTIQNGLSGTMVAKTDHFQVNGIPLTPINDSKLGVKNPYQVAEISVKNAAGAVVAKTQATVPTSDEINCAKCHGSNPLGDIIAKHNDQIKSVTLTAPVLCASCHGSPALSMPTKAPATTYLSQAIHGFHASKGASCYDCHPGATTQCSRSVAHMGTGGTGNCTSCHGDMANVANTITNNGRVPWVNEPKCGSCHTATLSPTGTSIPALPTLPATSSISQVDTGTTLYRNAVGHGGISCAACHGSPHAMVPTTQAPDNYQANQYMGSLPSARTPQKSMGSCGDCHSNSKPHSAQDWVEEHASGRTSACNVCHTGFQTPSDTTKWPHGFQWKSR